MTKKHYRNIQITIATLFLMLPFFAGAASYDFYVDAGYSGEEDGSKEKPFNTISDAIEAGSGKIFVGKGKYSEKVVLGKSNKLYGKDKGSVTISGIVVMKDGNVISDITINGGIEIEKNADVNIENCNIKSSGKIGIDIAPGNGKLSVLNSKIYSGGGKGIYVQAGNEVKITGNEIYENSEEGIDVRVNVSGTISGNSIYDNGESGIEIIAGSSEVSITKNKIIGNHASGIATQFYKENKKIGDILIQGNTMSKNGKYGLDCAIPSGGAPSADYWSNSLNLNNNIVENNKLGFINDLCDIISVVEKGEEEKDNKITESKEDVDLSLSEEDLNKEEEILSKIEVIQSEIGETKNALEKSQEKIDKRNWFIRFFVGSNLEESDFLKNKKKGLESSKLQLESFLNETRSEEIKREIESIAPLISQEIEKCEKIIAKNESGFGIWGRFLKIIHVKKVSLNP